MQAAPLIPAFRRDEALVAEIYQSDRYDAHFRLWWLGQSGFLLQHKQTHLLIDPYLSDSLAEKYAGTAKPHLRMCEIPIDPAELGFVDILLSTHNHGDHLDRQSLLPILTAKDLTHFVLPEANRLYAAQQLSCDSSFAIGLTDGERIQIGPFTIHAVAAAHETIERDDEDRCRFLGYVIQCGDWSIYHSGDTRIYEGLVDVLRPFAIDVALLPINGADPARGMAGNMSASEAAALGKDIGAKLVVPHHFDMFAFNTGDPAVFQAECERLGVNSHVLQIGERFSSADWPDFAGRVPAAPTTPEADSGS